MENVVFQCKGTFNRVHGVFGNPMMGTVIFTDERVAFLLKKTGGFSKLMAGAISKIITENFIGEPVEKIIPYKVDEVFLKDIESCTKEYSRENKETCYVMKTLNGETIRLNLRDCFIEIPEKLLDENSKNFYRNSLEKNVKLSSSTSEIKAYLEAKHTYGLPIAEGIMCMIVGTDEEYVFKVKAQEYHLPMSKIKDVSIKTDKEISKSYVSDIGDVILGAHFFGAAGAMLGGKAREKTSVIQYHYLIFTYETGLETKFISFYVENVNVAIALTKLFQPAEDEIQKIEL